MTINDLGALTTASGAHGITKRWDAGTSSGNAADFDKLIADGGGTSDDTGVDALQVKTPNGFTVSACHFGGGSGFSAQLLSSFEETVSYLSGYDPSTSNATPQADGDKPGMETRCLDTFCTSLGDGESLTLHYGSEPDGSNKDPRAAEAMADVINAAINKFKTASNNTPAKLPDLNNLMDELAKATA